jgi:serine protease inhibitor
MTYEVASASQTATLDVNEDYAEGKALTEIGFRLTSACMPEMVHYLKMDQPYFIIIKDRTKDGVSRVVFTSWVANPK